MVTLAAQMIFGYNQLREGQLEAVESYLSSKDTLVSLKTEEGKTFYYAIFALLFKEITIVISLLKALMEDQKQELIHFGILYASIYVNTTQEKIKQNKIFEEIALGFIKIIVILDVQNICALLVIPFESLSVIWNSSFERKEIVVKIYIRKDNHETFSNDLLNLIKEVEKGKIIIYCVIQLRCDNFFVILDPLLLDDDLGIYHGGLGDE
ncbi:17016_t:CDS:2 [Funneliformis caledonium]|uniref:DNA 3'-5' helicase n=1 Tax=Funneliformis caledonium TaxID=1117310 RepID=A0A9N9G3W5_9GLOM|nr:17016_t:CDS:2 [Funneliformis caledonium]